ncbi:hypothetical protein [Roseibium sp. Sym1]|uniref:hypothetical protein n=1 Tax=Roseibium sp. Sym1 TaxID=3016006 RepID=UPI0022B50C01|nr:hypothetical protein [Roseibium sp. Sym1]
MITFRKRILAAGAPIVMGTVFLATALGAAETLTEDAEKPSTDKTAISVAEDAVKGGKGDLKMDLADARSRPMRCVSGDGVTTCTGWPVAADMIAYNN